jgi:uncharacterized protein YecA (UPF0149 family)
LIEKRLWSIASGLPLWVAPLTADGLEAYAREQGIDPNTSAARSQYAAELLRIGRAIPWPPGRNDPCWCGSGRKYMRCCSVARRRKTGAQDDEDALP